MRKGKTIRAFFENDHDEIAAILAAVDFAVPDRALPKLKEFDRRLERHIVWEEELLFPAAARAEPRLAQGPIAAMRGEHARIRACKARALECLKRSDGPGAKGGIEEMLAVLSGHSGKEEEILFPACDELIPADEVGVILRALSASPP